MVKHTSTLLSMQQIIVEKTTGKKDEPFSISENLAHNGDFGLLIYQKRVICQNNNHHKDRLRNVAATIPAVSVRNRVFPNDTGIKLFFKASSISSFVKSPSGPISIVELFKG
jgi:hypothetical protein